MALLSGHMTFSQAQGRKRLKNKVSVYPFIMQFLKKKLTQKKLIIKK